MAIIRHKVYLPKSEIFHSWMSPSGLLIASSNDLRRVMPGYCPAGTPIEMTIRYCEHASLQDCTRAEPDTWIEDFKDKVLAGKELPFWELHEVEFHRDFIRLGYHADQAGMEHIYISGEINLGIDFMAYEGEDQIPVVYRLDYRGAHCLREYQTSVEQIVSGKLKKYYEFYTDSTSEGNGKEYLIVSEFC